MKTLSIIQPFLLAILCSLVLSTFAQSTIIQEDFSCGFDLIHHQSLENDTRYKQNFLEREKEIEQYLRSNIIQKKKSGITTIPVVVHVFHLGEPLGTGFNLPDAAIFSAIDGLNAQWANVTNEGVDMEVEFCLAKRDMDNNPSTGIYRIDASGVPEYADYGVAYNGSAGANYGEIIGLSNWDPAFALNIWVVNDIVNIVGLGSFNGAMVQVPQMTYNDISLGHELGHTLSLYHTFQGSTPTTCPANVDCLTQGDRVCDTPPHLYTDCANNNSCGETQNLANSTRNYMGYCPNKKLFTQGQKDRVQGHLATARTELMSSLACLDVESSDVDAGIASHKIFCDDTIVVVLKNYGLDTLESATIGWMIDGMVQDSYSWLGNLATEDSTLVRIGSTVSVNSETFELKVWSANPNGVEDSDLSNDSLNIMASLISNQDTFFIQSSSCNPANIGTVVQSLTDVNGCDSIITTITSLLPSDSIVIQESSCNVADTGIFVQPLTNVNGCDSTVTTIISFLGITLELDSIAASSGQSDGGAYISVINGLPPFDFKWSDSSTMEDLEQVYPGIYSLQVTDGNGCTDSLVVNVGLTTNTSVSKEQFTFDLYPNPVNQILRINVSGLTEKQLSLQVIDVLGKIVEKKASIYRQVT